MWKRVLALALALAPVVVSAQDKPVLVVNPFTTASGVELPYDLKQLHGQLVAELRVMLGKEFSVTGEAPASATSKVFTLDGEIVAWRPGNAAKRLFVGMGSGREASDIAYRVTDASGAKVLDKKDTIRTNFYSQGAGSTGTLGHPIAQKIAERIKTAKLR
jgi:hypothetical protein